MSIEVRPLPVVTPEDEELDILVMLRDTDLDGLDEDRYWEFYNTDWDRLLVDLKDAEQHRTSTVLDLRYPRDSKKIDNVNESYNILTEWRNSIVDEDSFEDSTSLIAGIDLLSAGDNNRFQQLALRNGVGDITQRSADLLGFQSKGYLYIRYGGVSLYEFANTDIPTPQGFQFLLDSFHNKPDGGFGTPDSINMVLDHPVLLHREIKKMPRVTNELVYTDSDEITDRWYAERGTRGKAVSKTVQLLNKVRDIRRKVDGILIDPSSPDFSQLKQLIESYFDDPNCDELFLTFLMTNEQDREYVSFYRRIKQLQKAGMYPEFYGEIARRLESSNSVYLEDERLINSQEFNRITSDIPQGEAVTLDRVVTSATRVASISSREEFELKGENLEALELPLAPSQIHLQIDIKDRKKSIVRFSLDQVEGKTLEVTFDGRNLTVDWHMMPEMGEKERNIILQHLLQTYQGVINQIELEKEQRKLEAEAQAQARKTMHRPMPKRTKPQEELYLTSKNGKNGTHPAEEVIIVDLTEVSQEPEIRVQHTIVADDEIVADAKGKMPPDHFDQVMDKIEQFNNGLTSGFKKLTGFSDEMYRLFCGKYRVIVEEVESPNGERTFVMRSIELRNNEYREYKKGRLKSKRRK